MVLMKHVRLNPLLATLACVVAACSQSFPDYQPDDQPSVHIQQRATRAHGLTEFTVSGEGRPVFSMHASSSDGGVSLYVMNQRLNGPSDSTPFQVLCNTAKLLSGNEVFAPSEIGPQPTNQNDPYRIGSCVGTVVINGDDKLVGVILRFESGKALTDRFSVLLPSIDLGPGVRTIQSRTVTFSKRMLKEVGGIR
jgi:hypothetical protein